MRILGRTHKFGRGFTLAELLISLAILGLIATFSLPKLIDSVNANHHKTLLKETIGAIAELVRKGHLDGSYRSSNQISYFVNNLAVRQFCPTNAYAEGCTTFDGYGWSTSYVPAAVLNNGVTLFFFYPENHFREQQIFIDVNGSEGPNLSRADLARPDSDVLWLFMLPSDVPASATPYNGLGEMRLLPGQVEAEACSDPNGEGATECAYYKALFQ